MRPWRTRRREKATTIKKATTVNPTISSNRLVLIMFKLWNSTNLKWAINSLPPLAQWCPSIKSNLNVLHSISPRLRKAHQSVNDQLSLQLIINWVGIDWLSSWWWMFHAYLLVRVGRWCRSPWHAATLCSIWMSTFHWISEENLCD